MDQMLDRSGRAHACEGKAEQRTTPHGFDEAHQRANARRAEETIKETISVDDACQYNGWNNKRPSLRLIAAANKPLEGSM